MPPQKKRFNTELLLGISATILSIAALIVSIFQTRIAREQQQASVWPYLQTEVYKTVDNDPDKDQLQVKLTNNGVGPAIIKQVRVRFRAKSYSTHFDAFDTLINRDSLTDNMVESYRSLDVNKVIKAGEEWTLYEVTKNRRVVQQINRVANDSSFHLRISYSDIYGNCWQLDQGQVIALGKCP